MNRNPHEPYNNDAEDGTNDSGNGMDELLKDVFREDAVPPEVEDRLRGRMTEFRRRLDGREERDRRRPWWAALFAPSAAGRLAIAGGAACGVLVLLFVLTAPQSQSLFDPNRGKVDRVRDDTRILTVAVEAYPVSGSPAGWNRGDASGTLSTRGDFLASSGGKANPASASDIDGDGDVDLYVGYSDSDFRDGGIPKGTTVLYHYDDIGAVIRRAIPTPVGKNVPVMDGMAGSSKRQMEAENEFAGAFTFQEGTDLNRFSTLNYSYQVLADSTSPQIDALYADIPAKGVMPQKNADGYYLDAFALGKGLALAPQTPEFFGNYTVVGDLNGDGGLDVVVAVPTPASAPEPPSALPDYDRIVENAFLPTLGNPLSTFSIDVDTASYSNMRRLLMAGQLPPADAVRIEEMINYFPYDYPQPTGDAPFSVTTEIASCPWAPEHRLLRIGLKGYEIPADQRPPSNLVFLIDVSGSMDSPEKLPLLKEGFKVFVDHLNDRDRVAIVVYAGASGLVLPSTPATERQTILDALNNLQAGGSTNGGEGIQLAYDIAAKNFIKDGVNRVILATDGDFNVGVTDRAELVRLIEAKAKTGVFLSVLGYGICGCKDAVMEELSNKGNGNYAYIDDALEARRVLVDQMSATLVTIAKDVKIQVEFNPGEIAAYRLIGYENRMLAKEDFNDDTKDAGEIGAGHTVTALYELVPAEAQPGQSGQLGQLGQSSHADPIDLIDLTDNSTRGATATGAAAATTPAPSPTVDALKYQEPVRLSAAAETGEALTVKLRYKKPDGDTSSLLEQTVRDTGAAIDAASPDLKFAAAVAGFGLLLRKSEYKGTATYPSIHDLAKEGVGADPYTYRSEFVDLVELAASLAGTPIEPAKE